MASDDMNTQGEPGTQGGTDKTSDNERGERGVPGEGAGRRDEVGHTGIYPLSASQGVSEDAPVVAEGAVGQGDLGVEGYQDSGDSGIIPDKEIIPDTELTGTSPGDEAGAGGI